MAMQLVVALKAVAVTVGVTCWAAWRARSTADALRGCGLAIADPGKVCSMAPLSTLYTRSVPSAVVITNCTVRGRPPAAGLSSMQMWWAAGREAGSSCRLIVGGASRGCSLNAGRAIARVSGTSAGTNSSSRIWCTVENATKRPSTEAASAMTWLPRPVVRRATCSGSAVCPE